MAGTRAQRDAAVVPLPRRIPRQTSRASARRPLAPSTRLLAAVAGVAVLAALLYIGARETSVFAVRTIAVRGATPDLQARVREALRPLVGSSLVSFDRGKANRLLFSVSQVAGASFDRDFPHTLWVVVHAERAVAVLRQATDAWLVSARGRVLRQLETRPYPKLPRIWVPRSVDLSVNATVGGEPAEGIQAAAAAALARLPQSVTQIKTGPDELTLVLASGTEVRLGSPGDTRLKLAVARRILPLVPGAAYVDVSVPERSVALPNSQVGG